jgi:four helix bundle protein
MFRFETLDIWKSSVAYGKRLYVVANKFPKNETFALADQLKRAAVSVSSNIAEGSGGTKKDFSNFLNIAVKSIFETVSILYFAQEINYVSLAERKTLYDEAETLIKRIRAFRNSLLN